MVTQIDPVPPRLRAAGSGRVAQPRRVLALPRDLASSARFAVPVLAPWFTPRPRLLELLRAGEHLPLVLVSGSAGTGKTSLVADWLASPTADRDTCWVTLGAPQDRLWPLVLTALQRIGVQVPDPPEGDSDHLDAVTLTTLATTLAARSRPVRLVIDGYEGAPTSTSGDLDLLLRCAAAGLRLVIVTRVDPAVRLYRHRLEGSVLEIRDRDLAFDDDEARLLLERAGLGLSPSSVHDLNTRVGGWATGLRFAARALVSAPDPDAAVDEVVANTSDINEYLLGEVLDAQPPEVRRLLLAASVPDTLFPELVDELAGPGARLSSCLRRLNAFLEPVSGAPGCQRYHPFFRDLLRAQLAYESPDVLVDLHRRAGTWLVRQGLLDAGVSHLVAAGLREAAATAVIDGLALERLLLCRDDDPIVRAFGSEPVAPAGPAEQLVRAGVALGRGRHAECHRLLAAARLAIPSEGREEGSEEGTPNRARLDAAAALLDAVRARDHESPDEAAALADRATHLLDRLDGALVTEHPELTALVTSCRGVAQLRAGRLAEAARTLAGGAATAPGGSPERLHALGHLALVEALEGRLSQAADNAALALGEEVEGATDGVLQSSAGEVALAVVSLERMDLDAADSHLRAANRGRTSPVCRGLAAITEAGVHQSRGHVDKAMEVIAAARADLRDDDEWLDRRVALEAARVRVSAGSARQALADLSGVEQEPEASVLAAQAHLREGRHQEVASCLEQARETEVPLHARIVSILVEAAHESHRRSPARTRGLVKQSLRLAASERMRRPFLEAPSDIQRLLHHDPQLATHAAWLARHPVRATPATSAHRGSTSPGAPAPRAPAPVEGADLPAVVEPLTTKELEVLGHLAELLSTQEIAATMFISVNTVRTHVRNILRKLGVSRRSAAVRRARQLQIV